MPTSVLARQFIEAQREMAQAHDGDVLLRGAQHIVADLDEGPYTFAATSVEGVALAAVCAAIHGCGSDWTRLRLTGPAPDLAHRPVLVEPVDGGTGWRRAIERRYPDVLFRIVQEASALVAS